MKKLILLALAVFAFGFAANAQKLAYINMQRLIEAMPERDSALVKLQNYEKELGDQLELIQVEYNNKVNDLQKQLPTMTDAVKQLKEKELRDLQNRYMEFQQSAGEEMQRMENQLMQPILTKAQEAIKKAGKAGSFAGVFNETVLIYHDDVAMTDLLPVVLKDLGIKEKPAAAAAKK